MATPSRRSLAVSRREFISGAGALAVGLIAGSCQSAEPIETTEPTPTAAPSPEPARPPTAQPTSRPTPQPTVPAATSTPVEAVAPTPTASTAGAARPESRARVAVTRAQSYDPGQVRDRMGDLLDNLGGLGDIVSAGDRVTVKVNLVGGTHFEPPSGVPAVESHMTHPEVVHALGELLRDAGARELLIVEAVYEADAYSLFGYDTMAAHLGATLIDLNGPGERGEFVSMPVGDGAFIYDALTVNHLLDETDAFVSVTKMKCHYNAGVTLSMKNLVGILPVSQYRLQDDHWWRSAVHGADHETPRRLPRIIVDLCRARPLDLAVIDGIRAAEGGEVPRGTFSPVEPGILIAGKNAVATDAVATAAMGFDPTAEPPTPPFLRGDNYLNLARDLGLGTNRLEEIAIVGDSIDNVRFEFEPAWHM